MRCCLRLKVNSIHFLTAGAAELAVQRVHGTAVRAELHGRRIIGLGSMAFAGHFGVAEFRFSRCIVRSLRSRCFRCGSIGDRCTDGSSLFLFGLAKSISIVYNII